MTNELLAPESVNRILAYLQVDPERYEATPTHALLDALVTAYVRRVPWESAFRIAKRAATEDTLQCPRWPDEFWTDALTRGGGGTCFESNYAFFALLQSLSYGGYLTINNMNDFEACHTAIVIHLDDQPWLVDVGLPLHAPLPLGDQPTERHTALIHYTVTPQGDHRYEITRAPHPSPYAFTLIDEPIPDEAYRLATAGDYGPDGLFLDAVVVNKVIDETLWRFNSKDQPPRLEQFIAGERIDHFIGGDVAAAVASRFGLDEATVRLALAQIAPNPAQTE